MTTATERIRAMPSVGLIGDAEVIRRKFRTKPEFAAVLDWWTAGTGRTPAAEDIANLQDALRAYDTYASPPAEDSDLAAEANDIATALGYPAGLTDTIAGELQQARLKATIAESRRRWARQHGAAAAGGDRTLNFMTTDTWENVDYPPTRERVEGLLPAVGMGLIAAREKVGKSLWAIQATIAIASGLPFLGRPTSPCPTLYVEEEGSEWNLRERRRKQQLALNALAVDAHWLLRQQFRLDNAADVAALSTYVRDNDIKVVFIGPLAQVTSLTDENAVAEMTTITRTLTQLATEHEALFVLLHHRRKDGKDGVPNKIDDFFQTVRGSSALMGAVDVAIGLDRKPEDEHGRMFVLQRDGASFIEYYGFSPVSLCITPEAKPDTSKAPADQVLELITANPGITVRTLASLLSVTEPTVRTRITALIAENKVFADSSKKGGTQHFPMSAAIFGGPAAVETTALS